MTILATLALSAATGSLLALPLTPALAELRRRRDATPLPTRTDDAKIGNFAHSMRAYMKPLTELQDTDSCFLKDGRVGRVIRNGEFANLCGRPLDTVVYVPESLVLPLPACLIRELYVRGDLHMAGGSLLRAALIDGDVRLGEHSSVMRWIHAGGDLEAGPGTRLFGRASAGGSITLGRGSSFERMSARTIYSGFPSPARPGKPPTLLPGLEMVGPRLGRIRSRGDFHLGDSDSFQGHIIAAGKVTISENVQVFGSIKARSAAEIESGTHVEGSIISRGSVAIAHGCFVKGPILSEREIVIGADTQIGTPGCLATVSAPRIRIAVGSRIFGTLWAREAGEVTA